MVEPREKPRLAFQKLQPLSSWSSSCPPTGLTAPGLASSWQRQGILDVPPLTRCVFEPLALTATTTTLAQLLSLLAVVSNYGLTTN